MNLDFGIRILDWEKGIYSNPNPGKLEITNYKYQITNKFQITISKSQTRSGAN
jgi:hypothetical protein